MDEPIKTWLYDILKSIFEIEEYFTGKKKIFADFVSDIKTKRAVERNLEIIGEAVGRILKANDKIKISVTIHPSLRKRSCFIMRIL